MRYAVWFVRFLFAAWMIPAGLNHFVPIFPQPMGSQPLSQELIHALIDSSIFDLVKAVELIAGVGVLLGFYTPLMLLVCLPVSFCVFYWDAPLEGWGSRAALFGYSTFLCNLLLCAAYNKSYRAMFTLRAAVDASRKQLVLGARVVFGIWMVLNSANYLFLSLWTPPAGVEPLAVQLMTSLVNSRLLDVAMVIQLVTGALILAGVMVPAALALSMPILTCALYWALILDHQPLNMLLACAAFALNGLLMLAYLPYYKGVLQRHALAVGEAVGESMNYEALFVSAGRTSQAAFIPAAVTIALAIAVFAYMVGGRTAHFCMLMLVYPAFVLLGRRLQDMGFSRWMALVPTVVALVAFAAKLQYLRFEATVEHSLAWSATGFAIAVAVWAATGRSK
jgi:uncharacterized membrane protein YphA (DoxX/SURF4 family)/uncharacterized membrane protein YhaH (DUF805 family)